jgi:hypothetical protein
MLGIAATALPPVPIQAQASMDLLGQTGANQREALKVAERIYQAIGFGNTFMVTTPEGNVIIDTSINFAAPRH